MTNPTKNSNCLPKFSIQAIFYNMDGSRNKDLIKHGSQTGETCPIPKRVDQPVSGQVKNLEWRI
jgi:hypothetical protein